MACITTLEQNLDQTWAGRSLKTGETRKFRTLEDYNQYVKSLQDQGTYCPNVDTQYLPQYKPGANTTHTGFLEFQVRDPIGQAKHSAMSPSWEGVASSEASIARGDYDLDMAEKTRHDLRAKKQQPVYRNPDVRPEPAANCSIQ